MELGNNAEAEAYLSLAIKLSDHPADPLKRRGMLYANQGRWADARRDFATMAEHEPGNPDAWFMRAQAALALDDVIAAKADMQQALAVAPKDWSFRPGVAQILTELKLPPAGK
jgi:tetratricopeptide (TPR) repeat protein